MAAEKKLLGFSSNPLEYEKYRLFIELKNKQAIKLMIKPMSANKNQK